MARRGGVKRISADVYNSTRVALKAYLTDVGGVPLMWRVVLMRGRFFETAPSMLNMPIARL